MIAAAEARDKQNKQKKKPIRKPTELSAAEKKRIEDRREQLAVKNETYMADAPLSDEARRAVEAAKTDEVAHANQLGYNPYEAVKGTGQQASNTVTNITHGAIHAGSSGSSSGGTQNRATKKTPSAKSTSTIAKPSTSTSTPSVGPINPTFDDAFASLVTTNGSSEQIKKSLRIMRKLIANATAPNLDVDDNKRKVRISNPNKHIQAAVNDMNGALDVMFSVGFIMSEDEVDSETYLVYPPGDVPSWLTAALQRMEQYESGL